MLVLIVLLDLRRSRVRKKWLLEIRGDELPLVARASFFFTLFSAGLQTMNAKACDEALTGLQRLRTFLERFSAVAENSKMRSPIQTLDFLAQKKFGDLGSISTAVLQATSTSLMLQRLLLQCFSMPPQQQPFQVDTKHLH